MKPLSLLFSVILSVTLGVEGAAPEGAAPIPKRHYVHPRHSLVDAWQQEPSRKIDDLHFLEMCDVSFRERAVWALKARADLELQGFDVAEGKLLYAPIGTISNPEGTYGGIVMDIGDAFPSQEYCDCIGGNTSVAEYCQQLQSYTFSSHSSESVCKANFVLGPRDAIVVLGCTPPESQYFSLQTNTFARFGEGENGTGVYYPEISPFDTINNGIINTTGGLDGADPWGCAFLTVSSADRRVAERVSGAFVRAGLPASAVNFDPLGNADYVTFLSDGSEWTQSLPDTLETVFRINKASDEAAMGLFIDLSILGSQMAFVVRSGGDDMIMEPLTGTWRPRVVSEAEEGIQESVAKSIDSVVGNITAEAGRAGYTLSYMGSMAVGMDYGYTQDPNDVEACCLPWPHNETWWSFATHFSTRDCLYGSFGLLPDLSQYSVYNGGVIELIGDTMYTSTEAVGSPESLSHYSSYSCDANDTVILNWQCTDDDCGNCTSVVAAAFGLDGCYNYGDGSFEVSCSSGEVVEKAYSDAFCNDLISTIEPTCNKYETIDLTDELWTGGFIHENTVIVVVGAMSNNLNLSAFHDIYLPIYSHYTDADVSNFDFLEEDLAGTGLSWGGGNDIYVAQFGRSCFNVGTTSACNVIDEAALSTNTSWSLISRAYFDPTTNSGPSKEAVPRQRVLVFDLAE